MIIYLSVIVCTVCWTDNCRIVPNVYRLNLIILSHQSFNWHLKYYITRLHSQYMYTKITKKWPGFNSTLKQSCQYLIADNYKESPANWNNFFSVSNMQNIRMLIKLQPWGQENTIKWWITNTEKMFFVIFLLPQMNSHNMTGNFNFFRKGLKMSYSCNISELQTVLNYHTTTLSNNIFCHPQNAFCI